MDRGRPRRIGSRELLPFGPVSAVGKFEAEHTPLAVHPEFPDLVIALEPIVSGLGRLATDLDLRLAHEADRQIELLAFTGYDHGYGAAFRPHARRDEVVLVGDVGVQEDGPGGGPMLTLLLSAFRRDAGSVAPVAELHPDFFLPVT